MLWADHVSKMQSACVMQLAHMQMDKSISASPANSAEEGCCHTSGKTACAPTDNGQTLISELSAWPCI